MHLTSWRRPCRRQVVYSGKPLRFIMSSMGVLIGGVSECKGTLAACGRIFSMQFRASTALERLKSSVSTGRLGLEQQRLNYTTGRHVSHTHVHTQACLWCSPWTPIVSDVPIGFVHKIYRGLSRCDFFPDPFCYQNVSSVINSRHAHTVSKPVFVLMHFAGCYG